LQKRGLIKYVKGRTLLPTSVDEMTAFYDFHMKMTGTEVKITMMTEHIARMNVNQ
jgi:hypothetical protein